MEMRLGGLGTVGGGLLLLLFAAVAFGHATWALQSGASRDDPGLVTSIGGPMGTSRHRRGTPLTLGTQQVVGGVGMVGGLVVAFTGLVLPVLLRQEE